MTENTGTIPEDVQSGFDGESGASGFDAFLADLTGEEPRERSSTSDGDAEGDQQRVHETPADADEGEPSKTEDADPNDPDNAEVEIKVGEETKKATLRELKRLYGQEASLTQKSQAAAEAARAAQATNERAGAALKAMITRAQDRYKPYADLDMLVLSQRMDTEAFAALRADAAAAKAEVDFLTAELDTHVSAEREKQSAASREAAQACVKELSDPEKGIPNWGEPLYNELMVFAKQNGLHNANTIVSAPAIRVLHMAYQFSRGAAAAESAARKVTNAPAAPSKILKPGQGKGNPSSRDKEAMAVLRKSGSVDDAASAFLASFAS